MPTDRGRLGRSAPPLIGLEWRDFLRWPLYATLFACLALFALAYQVHRGAALSVDVGAQGDTPYLVSFGAQENSQDKAHPFNFRWSLDLSYLVFPGVGRNVPIDLTINAAGRPQNAPPAQVTVNVNGSDVAALHPVGYPPGPYTVHIPAQANNRDDMMVALTSNAYSPPGDSRKLGVVIDSVSLQPAGGGIVRPPTYVLAWLLLSALLAFLTLRHLGVSRAITAASVIGLALLAAFGLALSRYEVAMFSTQVGVTMICVYVMALLIPLLVDWFMKRLRVPITAGELRALMLIFLVAFAIKSAGMMHPQFLYLDHVFRVHEVQELVTNPAAFWDKYERVTTADQRGTVHSETEHSMLGQWNLVVPFPYSPFGYFVLAPLGWIWPVAFEDRLVTASDTMLAALSGTLVFALFAIARRGLGSGRGGVIAAVIVSFAPITYLHFSDGAYPYIWAGWISVVYIMAAICLAGKARRPGPFILLTALSALTVLSHTAIAAFAVVFVGAAIVINLLLRRLGGGRWASPYSLMPLFWSFAAGVVVSLVYYGAYIWPLLTVALPAILQKSAGGGVGLDPRNLGRPLLYGFGPQIEAHFTTWPVLLAAAGLAMLVGLVAGSKGRRGARVEPHDSTVRASMLPLMLVFLGAWAATFLIFSLADLRVNLLQRHMLFGLPLVALLAGYALDRLDLYAGARLRPLYAPAISLLLVGYLILSGLEMWVGRVLHYQLPPGSG